MKKFFYSKKGKALLYILQSISVLVLVLSISILYLYTRITIQSPYGTYEYNINFFDGISEYEESDYFNQMLASQVSETIRYAVIRNQLETGGVFDGKKPIDIEDFSKRYEPSKKEYTSVSYYIEDLIKWGQYGVEFTNDKNEYKRYDEIPNAKKQIVETEAAVASVEDAEAAVMESPTESTESTESTPPEIQTEEELTLASVEMQGGYIEAGESEKAEPIQYKTSDGWRLVERYKTVDGLNLSDYVTDELTYDALCGYLTDTANSLAYNYSQYKNYNKMFQDNQTNLSYYITLQKEDGRQNVYTNMVVANEEEAKAIIEGMGQYLNYDANTLSYTTTTTITEEDLVRELNYYDYTYYGNRKILIGIDTKYLYQDSFMEGYQAYNEIVPKIPYLIGASLLSVLLLVAFFFTSCIVTGRSEEESEVSIIFFDKFKTEIFLALFAAVVGGGGIAGGIILSELYYYEMEKNTLCIAIGGTAVLLYSFFLFFVLSLLRRIKVRNIWNNSILYAVLCLLRKLLRFLFKGVRTSVSHIYKDGSLTVRTWVPYLTFLALNLLLIVLGLKVTFIAFILAGMLDLAVGIYLFRENKARETIIRGIETITAGELNYQVDTENMNAENVILAESVNALGEGIRKAVETSMKDERLKADLITNVSHDIKTPLTSIINYVDLIKRENIQDEKIKKYVEVLDAKSQRLKYLTEDLVEASKISSGNITLVMEKINFVELLNQGVGEFFERFGEKGLQLISSLAEHPIWIEADSRRIWRVIENLGNNVAKYAMPNSRVYLDLHEVAKEDGMYAVMSLKNISEQSLNIDASELTERFIRGDVSRSTEGSGLGLSIAKNLTELQNGKFDIYLDGDLFKVTLTFKVLEG